MYIIVEIINWVTLGFDLFLFEFNQLQWSNNGRIIHNLCMQINNTNFIFLTFLHVSLIVMRFTDSTDFTNEML